MQDPAREISAVVKMLTTAPSATIQQTALARYYTSDAAFRHPICTVPSAHRSRDSILAIYQWYRVMSPKIEMDIRSVVYDSENHVLFVDCAQKFHIRFSPFRPVPARLLVRLTLREENDLWYVCQQEDFYHPEDFVALLVPPLIPPIRFALRAATFASYLGTRSAQLVFGQWQ
ncbi:hypothetical protein OF83DRAFT_500961 [Amylostereum chailletii]|nr:hypothetical protein OF83DRAFT_500961 [Amylostereum chailletii]